MQGVLKPGFGPLTGLSPLGAILTGTLAPSRTTHREPPRIEGDLKLRFPRPGVDVERADLKHLEAFLKRVAHPGRSQWIVLSEAPRNPLTNYRLYALARRYGAAVIVKPAPMERYE